MTASECHFHTRHRRRRLRIVLPVLLILLALLVWRMERNLTGVVLNLATARAGALAVSALHQSAEEVLGDGVAYASLMTVSYDDSGRVRLIEANTQQMNQLAAQVSLKAQKRLQALETERVEVPLGAALGLALLSGAGPRVRVAILPVGTVSAAMDTEFMAAGINQTRHTVMLRLRCTVRLVLPTGSQTIENATEAVVAEHIIVGEVPSAYLQQGDVSPLDLRP